MRKYILFGLLIFSTTLFGQKFNAGLIGGIAGSQIDNDGYKGYDKMGLILGVFVNRNISKNVKWQLEIKYIGKGAAEKLSQNFQIDSTSGNAVSPIVPYKVTLRYIELPLLLIIRVSPKSTFELGPAIGFLVSQSMNDFQGNGQITPNQLFNPLEFSGIVGFGYHFNPKLSVNLRFQYSLYPVGAISSNPISYFTSGYFNNTLALAVYYNLGVKK
jgi:hypothetical protein